MKDFPSCFGESGVQIIDSSSSSTSAKSAQNLVTCVYQCKLDSTFCLITIVWTRTLMGQGVSVEINDSGDRCLCKVDVKPWLFSKRKGFKTLDTDPGDKLDLHWDFNNAKFGSGPEPLLGFYFVVLFNKEVVLFVGDMKKEASKKIGKAPDFSSNSVLIAKREHLFGKKFYNAKTRFWDNGKMHDVVIECDASLGVKDSNLTIRVDGKCAMAVTRLRWKFRGNHTILVDGVGVEVFWDVYNWLFGNGVGSAVFMFQSCFSSEKLWSPAVSDPAVLSLSCSGRFRDYQLQGLGFSLMLYAWKNE